VIAILFEYRKHNPATRRLPFIPKRNTALGGNVYPIPRVAFGSSKRGLYLQYLTRLRIINGTIREQEEKASVTCFGSICWGFFCLLLCPFRVANCLVQCSKARSAIREMIFITQKADVQIVRCNRRESANSRHSSRGRECPLRGMY